MNALEMILIAGILMTLIVVAGQRMMKGVLLSTRIHRDDYPTNRSLYFVCHYDM